MRLIPSFGLAVLNGWLFLAAYFIGLILTVLAYPRGKRKKLFLEPLYPKGDWRGLVIIVGRLAAVSFVALTLFTPLQTGTPFLYLGLVIYLLGFSLVMVSLMEYRRAEESQLVTRGIYQISRNPQWVGLALVFLGTTIAMATWLQLVLLLIVVIAYHFQILLEEGICMNLYGEEYKAYVKLVPRYWGF
jgi:protein-S-isoprenylcysteine O-methyltransferase Ste14